MNSPFSLRLLGALAAASAFAFAGCGPNPDNSSAALDVPSAQPSPSGHPTAPARVTGVLQPGFAALLPFTTNLPDFRNFEVQVPLQRVGSRIQLGLAAGAGGATYRNVRIARAGTTGDGTMVTFNGGQTSIDVGDAAVVSSDLAEVSTDRGSSWVVTFEAKGAIPTNLRPGLTGEGLRSVSGLRWVGVSGEPQQVVALVGANLDGTFGEPTQDKASTADVLGTMLEAPVLDETVTGHLALFNPGLANELAQIPGVTDTVIFLDPAVLPRDPQRAVEAVKATVNALAANGRVFVLTMAPGSERDDDVRTAVNGLLAQPEFEGKVLDSVKVFERFQGRGGALLRSRLAHLIAGSVRR